VVALVAQSNVGLLKLLFLLRDDGECLAEPRSPRVIELDHAVVDGVHLDGVVVVLSHCCGRRQIGK